MKNKILFTSIFLLMAGFSFGQMIDVLKLDDSEVPAGYSKTDKLQCVTPNASAIYEKPDLYEKSLGKITKKDFQSFGKRGDKGTILYFEFDKDFSGQEYLEGLLWGSATKPNEYDPEDYYAKGNILVIWSFKQNSLLAKASMAKVKGRLD